MPNVNLEQKEFRGGLTSKTVLALIVSILLFVPVNTYAYLMLGMSVAGVSIFFITILFIEVSRLFYKEFTRQEALILYYAGWWGGMTIPIYLSAVVYQSYFVNSPFAWSYKIQSKPIAYFVPSWLAPPYGSEALNVRTIFQSEYFIPVTIWTIYSMLALIIEISLAIIAASLYVEREKLPFPFASVDVSMVTFLTERPVTTLVPTLLTIIVGAFWGIIAYMPNVIGIRIIPIPFYDLTWAIENILPGGLFAVSTLLSEYILGFIIPISAATYMLLSSIVIWLIFNSLFATFLPNIFPEWAEEYTRGMGLISVQSRSFIRVWFAPQVGFIIAISLFLILKGRKSITSLFKQIFRLESKENILALPSIKTAIALFICASACTIILHHYLIPEIPLWIPIFYTIIISFFNAIILTAVAGEMGITLPSSAAGIWTTLLYLTPYQGYAGFVFSPPVAGGGPQLFCRQVKAALTTKTKISDLLKLWVLGFILTIAVGLVSVDIFWRIAPIPSSAYPMSVYIFFQSAFSSCLIVTRTIKVTLERIFIPALSLFGILTLGDLISSRYNLFFSAIGISTGVFMLPHSALAIFSGAILGEYLMPRFFGGREKWNNIKAYMVMGEMLGEGIIVVISTALSLIAKSAWLWPW
jgi:hypothetical protein